MADLDSIEFRLRTLEQDSDRNNNTHKTFYAKFEEVNSSVVILKSSMEMKLAILSRDVTAIMPTLNEIKEDLKQLKSKPGKRWELIITGIITACVSGVVGYIIAAFLK